MGKALPLHCEPTDRANAPPMINSTKQSMATRNAGLDCFVANAPRNDGGNALSTAYRRHDHPVAAAGAAIDFLAGTELQILAHAEPQFAEPRPVACHPDRGRPQPGTHL